MDPKLIYQLRRALRANSIIMNDVKAYAQTLGAPDSSSPPPVGPEPPTGTVSSSSNQFTNHQQQLIKIIASQLPAPLTPFKDKFSNKVKTYTSDAELKVFATDLMELIKQAKQAQQADPKAAQAITQSLGMFIPQAEKRQAPPSNLSQVTSKFKDEANASLESVAKSLAFGQANPNLRPYLASSYEPVDVTSPKQVAIDKAHVVGLPRTDGKELLALGFGVRRSAGLMLADNGRPAEQYLGNLFVIQKGENIATIEPAIKQVNGTIKRGIISLPLP